MDEGRFARLQALALCESAKRAHQPWLDGLHAGNGPERWIQTVGVPREGISPGG
jgi:hypothetical protein